MIKRAFIGLPPRITFTADFHELVRGDLQPGTDVRLRYDPARIVPPGEGYVFGDPAHRITAHMIFPPNQDILSVPLQSPSGMLTDPDTDATGIGDMLAGTAHVPNTATEIVMWFTHEGPYGQIHYDSDLGSNFHFGFPSRQIKLLDAAVKPGTSASDSFIVKVAVVPEVHQITVRMRVVGTNAGSDYDLQPSGERQPDGWLVWALDPVAVPNGAVVRFKLYYWVGNVRYKDDNSGLYYLVHQGQVEHVPPPPAALAKAARAWG
jgi:hypothetical protein